MNCREKGTKWDLPHLMFLAQQILADVEELFEGPFGEVPPDGMMAGPGGQPGYINVEKRGRPDEVLWCLERDHLVHDERCTSHVVGTG